MREQLQESSVTIEGEYASRATMQSWGWTKSLGVEAVSFYSDNYPADFAKANRLKRPPRIVFCLGNPPCPSTLRITQRSLQTSSSCFRVDVSFFALGTLRVLLLCELPSGLCKRPPVVFGWTYRFLPWEPSVSFYSANYPAVFANVLRLFSGGRIVFCLGNPPCPSTLRITQRSLQTSSSCFRVDVSFFALGNPPSSQDPHRCGGGPLQN